MRFRVLTLVLCVAALPAVAADSTVTRAQAEKAALVRVPTGVVKSAELETEHGKQVWSFDIATPASKDIHEIQVDATSGQVVRMEIETPADQARERAADKHEAKTEH
ncbi:PepSY domain-containing protein [Lysobacter sp. 2RAF19]